MSVKTFQIDMGEGVCPAKLFEPESGSAGTVMLYMDAFGPRPALDEMAERLVAASYAVLIPDLLWRYPDRGEFDAKTTFSNPEKGPRLREMLGATTQTLTIGDTGRFLNALSANGHGGPVAVTGYCMGGARALNAAAHHADRVVAAASWHGGNLAGDNADSPHSAAAKMTGRIYVGVAGVDQSFPPEQSAIFAKTMREAEIDHTIENYVGCAHGWCVPDHGVYDQRGAERHWTRLLTFLGEVFAA